MAVETHAPITTAAPPKPTSKRHPLHSEDVTISRPWMALAGLNTLGGLAVLRRYGWPAALGYAALGGMVGLYATLIEPRWPVLERFELRLPRLPPALDGLRVGQISDTHLGLPAAAHNLRWALAQMRREQPDLLVFTGDFIHRPAARLQLPVLLAGVRAPLGVFAVPGNHDGWESGGALRGLLAEAGVELMHNEHRRIAWRGGELFLLGLDDIWDGSPDLEQALVGVPHEAFTLLLAHTPHAAPAAAKLGIDLQLSGHTHGGHMVLPLLGPIAKPRYTGQFLSGLFQLNHTTLYVSRGLGGAPLRLACRPEAALITLRSAA
ncbi:MAG: metallophosphoesterase [Roseiflexaceae bacterium]|nr:metallophosphoesterase [Roseiflexaceae bacterium]